MMIHAPGRAGVGAGTSAWVPPPPPSQHAVEKRFPFGTRIKRWPVCLFVCLFACFALVFLCCVFVRTRVGRAGTRACEVGPLRLRGKGSTLGSPGARECCSPLQQGVATGPDRVSPLAPETPSSHWGSLVGRAGSLDRNPRPLHGPRDGQKWSWCVTKGQDCHVPLPLWRAPPVGQAQAAGRGPGAGMVPAPRAICAGQLCAHARVRALEGMRLCMFMCARHTV